MRRQASEQGRTQRKRGLRPLVAPFTVAAPGGARIRDRLRVSEDDVKVLTLVGEHLGRYRRADLAERIRLGDVKSKDTQRAERKKRLTVMASSRWAGAMTRASEDQYQLSMRCLYDRRIGLRRAVTKIAKRLAVPCGERRGKVRGYADQAERFEKQRRLQHLKALLARVEERISSGRPVIVVGGRRLAKTRHNLAAAGLTADQWRARWAASRMFLTADGESGAPFGNYTITVDPHDGSVAIVLPEPLRYLANSPRGRYRLGCAVGFHHRRGEWLDRVLANRAVRYDITYHPGRDRWYLDASWAGESAALPTPAELAASGARVLAIDLNADHLAACVVDVHGNPIGEPSTVPVELTGSTGARDGRLRAAITHLITLARRNGCAAIAIENLGFADARRVGRETMGRGQRGKKFRRTVAEIPTARFRDRLRGMAYHAGLIVVAVDPAYTSKWGRRYWRKPLQQQTRNMIVTGHHAAAVAIGRRAFGHGIRRRPGVTAHLQWMGRRKAPGRRATGQAVPAPTVPATGPPRGPAADPRAHGTASPPRTTGPPRRRGGKTCRDQSDQPAPLPAPNTVRGAPRTSLSRPGPR